MELYDPENPKCLRCDFQEVCAQVTLQVLTSLLEDLEELDNMVEDAKREAVFHTREMIAKGEEIDIPPCPDCGAEVLLVDLDLFQCTRCEFAVDLNEIVPRYPVSINGEPVKNKYHQGEPDEVYLTPFGVKEVYH